MQVRVLKKEGQSSIRIYKMRNVQEMNNYINQINMNHSNSVKIILEGTMKPTDLSIINSLANDNAYKELVLQMGDYIILTKEDIHQKLEEEKYPSKRKNKTVNKRMSWSQEEDNLLWTGSEKILNRTEEAIKSRKAILNKQNNKIMNNNIELKDTGRANKRWSKSEIELFKQNLSIEEIAEKTGRTLIAIANKKRVISEYKMPKKANKNWTKSDVKLFKQGLSIEEIANQTNRTEEAVIFKFNKLKAEGKLPKNPRKKSIKQIEIITPQVIVETNKVNKSFISKIKSFFKFK